MTGGAAALVPDVAKVNAMLQEDAIEVMLHRSNGNHVHCPVLCSSFVYPRTCMLRTYAAVLQCM